VKVTAGVATIEGKTDVVQHKGVATRLARTGGARAVNNRIEVSEAAKTKAAANLAEGRRRAQTHRGQPRSEPRTSEPPAAAPRTTAPRSSSPRSVLPTQPPQASVPPAELRGARPPARHSDSSAVAPPNSGAADEFTAAPRRAVIRWEK
jgi:hypothetical protein